MDKTRASMYKDEKFYVNELNIDIIKKLIGTKINDISNRFRGISSIIF